MSLTKVTRSMIEDSVFNVKDFGAVGNGVANDRSAIKATIDAAAANGGGTVLFPAGTYLISGTQTTVQIPELNASIQYAATANDAQIYVQNVNNLNFKFDGSILQSDKTNGGYTLLFDGCSNLAFNNLRMTGATVMSGSTATTTGTNAIGFISLTQDSQNITLTNTRINDHYTSFDIAGDPTSAYRVTNVTLAGSTYFYKGYYGIACRGNGANVVVENMYVLGKNRAFFIYDTLQILIAGTVDYATNTNSGFESLVKAYTYNTRNVKIDCVFKNKANLVTPRLCFQSQHNPAVQPTPAYVADVFVTYTEENCGSFGIGIDFSYYQNSTLQTSTTESIFNNFTFVGNSKNRITTSTTLGASNVCVINLDNFYDDNNDVNLRKKEILNNTGFVGAKRFTYTPTLKFGGGATGITYTSATADYYIQGGFCTVIGVIELSAKGSSTGAVTITMPIYTREDTANLPMLFAIGQTGMVGLGGSIIGYVPASAGVDAVLQTQGATGTANLTDANFSNTSKIVFNATYPV